MSCVKLIYSKAVQFVEHISETPRPCISVTLNCPDPTDTATAAIDQWSAEDYIRQWSEAGDVWNNGANEICMLCGVHPKGVADFVETWSFLRDDDVIRIVPAIYTVKTGDVVNWTDLVPEVRGLRNRIDHGEEHEQWVMNDPHSLVVLKAALEE